MRKIELLKFKDLPESIFVVVANEGPLKKVLSDEEWKYIEHWKEVIRMENYHFVINRFIGCTTSS